MVGKDGTLTLAVKPEGLLGTQTALANAGRRETRAILERTIQSGTGRQWKVLGIG